MNFLNYKKAVDNTMYLEAGVTYSDLIARDMAPSMDNNMNMLTKAFSSYENGNENASPERFVAFFMKFHNLNRIENDSTPAQKDQITTVNLSKAALHQFTQGTNLQWGAATDGSAMGKFNDMVFRIRVTPTRDGAAGFLVERYLIENTPLAIDREDPLQRLVPLEDKHYMRVSGTFDIRDALQSVQEIINSVQYKTDHNFASPSN